MLVFRSLLVISAIALCRSLCGQSVREFTQRYCVECHSGSDAEGGVDLARLSGNVDSAKSLGLWVRAFDRVEAREMPPPDAEQPTSTERAAMLQRLSSAIKDYERKSADGVGRTVLRRLNRAEYEYTVRDLLHVNVALQELLPEDTPLHGFDTVSEGLRFSQLQIEKYLEAARMAVDAAIVLHEQPEKFHRRITLKEEKEIRKNLDTPEGQVEDANSGHKHRVIFRETDDAVVLFASGGNVRQFSASASGEYRFRVSAYAVNSQGEPVGLQIFAHRWQGKRLIGFFQMPEAEPRVAEFTVHLDEHELIEVQPHGGDFDEDGKGVWNLGADAFRGRGVAVQWIEAEGPLGAWPPKSTNALFEGMDEGLAVREIPEERRRWKDGRKVAYEVTVSDPEENARQVITAFAERAFRRPLEAEEAEPFVALALAALDENRSFVDAIRVGLQAVLVSPQFLLFDERPGRLEAHALATRLAYFLTSTAPDQELRRLASDGKLLEPEVLRAQTERLLESPRSAAFVENFTGQWLDLRRIDATSPDEELYPEFDTILKRSMVRESQAFFTEMLRHDLDIANLIDSDFVMIDHTLAQHYRIEADLSEEFVRVAVPKDSPRGGVLTQAAVLKVTANGTVTSPVIRGAWILSRILGKPPLPPPPSVGSIEPDTRGATTIRDLLAKHRDSDSCASCHEDIDPPGFALESFDVIGGYRERYRSVGEGERVTEKYRNQNIWQYKLGPQVDSAGITADGREFRDIHEFKKIMLTHRDVVMHALAEKLMTYATGAGVRFSDRAAIDRIVDDVAAAGGGLRSLVHAIVQSSVFQSK